MDKTYVVNAAAVAKQKAVSHFSVVSSIGTDKSSSLLYPRTKGEVFACARAHVHVLGACACVFVDM